MIHASGQQGALWRLWRTDLLAKVILCAVPVARRWPLEPALVTADRPHRRDCLKSQAGRSVPEETSPPGAGSVVFPSGNLGYHWGPSRYSENPGPINSQGRHIVLGSA